MSNHLDSEVVGPGYVLPALVDLLPTIRRINVRGSRHYYNIAGTDVHILPSVTTIVNKTIPAPDHVIKWWCDLGYEGAKKEMNRRAHYGTCLHILASNLMTEGEIDIDAIPDHVADYVSQHNLEFHTGWWPYEMQKDILAIAQWVTEKEVVPLAIEVPMASAALGYAGTADFIVELTFNRKRVLAMVDLKSGRNGFTTKHEAQLEAYRQLWNHLVPTMPIEMMFNLAPKDWRKGPTYEVTNQTASEGAAMWPHMLAMYRASEPPMKTVIKCSGKVKLGANTDANWSVLDLDKHLANLHRLEEEAARDTTVEELSDAVAAF